MLFERKLVETLIELNITKEVDIDVGKVFNGRNMKNMSLTSIVIDPSEVLDRNTISSRRILIDDYPIFTKVDPSEILESYIDDCLASGITPISYSYDELSECPPDVLPLRRKRKAKKMGDEPSETVKSPSRVAKTSKVMRRPLGTILEVEGEVFDNDKIS